MLPPVWDTGCSLTTRILGINLAYVTLAVWLKYAVSSRPPGSSRVVTALPIFLVNTVCPWIFNWKDELLLRLTTVFIFSWLCTFKVLAFCWGREPLRESMTVPQLAAATLLPLFPKPPDSSGSTPRGRLHDNAGSPMSLASRWLGKIVLLGTVVFTAVQYGDSIPGLIRHYLYTFGLYAFVGFLMDGPAALAVEALGMQIIPTFDQPWLSSSVADFWGRRWNIPTASVLRTIAYDPVIEGSLVSQARRHGRATVPVVPGKTHERWDRLVPASPLLPATRHAQEQHPKGHDHDQHHHRLQHKRPKPSMLKRVLALNSTFFVSGVVHEYIAWMIVGDGKWGWKWTLFFWIQAPLMTLEVLGAQLLRRAGVQMPRPLTIILTLAVLELLAYDWFFGFVEKDTDISMRVIAAVSSSYRNMLTPVQPLIDSLRTRLGL